MIAFSFAGGDPSNVASGLIGAAGQMDLSAWFPVDTSTCLMDWGSASCLYEFAWLSAWNCGQVI